MTAEENTTEWLSVIGIGEEGFEVLLPEARRLCEGARHILGAERHIASLPKDLQARAEPWLSPFGENLTKLDALQKTAQKTAQKMERAGEAPPVCVLATGDPLCYGVGATLVRRYGRASMRIVAWRSSFSLAAAAMGWAHDSFATLSLHGRPLGLLQRRLAPCARLLVMLARASDVERIAEMLCAEKLEASVVTMLSRLGSSEEQIVCSTAECVRDGLAALEKQPFKLSSDLSVLALELPAQPSVQSSDQSSDLARTDVFGQRLGLPDEAFVHDGQITKRHARALTLAALVPQRDALLWDVGAGAGSISIEWCLAGGRAVAIERDARRINFLEQNRARFALEGRLEIVQASAQNFLLEVDKEINKEITKEVTKEVKKRPQVIFVGGGLDKVLLESLLRLLAPDGRLVANVVSLAGEGVLLDAYRRHGGDLTRIAIAHAQPLGNGEAQAFSPQRSVTQYVYRA